MKNKNRITKFLLAKASSSDMRTSEGISETLDSVLIFLLAFWFLLGLEMISSDSLLSLFLLSNATSSSDEANSIYFFLGALLGR